MSPSETRARLAAREEATAREFKRTLKMAAMLIPVTGILSIVCLMTHSFGMIWVLTAVFWSCMFYRYFRMGQVERDHAL